MDILRIEWNGSKGFMEIYPDKFFPCTVEKAKKLFKLIDQWCSDETIADLDVYLHQEKEKALAQMKSDVKAYGDARQKRAKCSLYNSSRSLKTKVERYNRNIELLHTHTNERK